MFWHIDGNAFCPDSESHPRERCDCLRRSPLKSPLFPVTQGLVSSVVSGGASDSAAGMRARPAKVKSGNWSAVLRPSCYRTHKEQLLKAKVAVENVAFSQPVGAFEIEWCQHLPGKDCVRHIRRVFRNLLHHPIAQQFSLFVPASLTQVIGNVLHEASHDVLTLRRKRIVDVRGDNAVHPELFRDLSGLGDVVTTLGKLKRRYQRVERAFLWRSIPGSPREPRLLGEHHVHLGAGTFHLYAPHCAQKILRQFTRTQHLQEGALGVRLREHQARADFRAILEHNPSDAAMPAVNLSDGCARTNLHSQLLTASSESVRDRAHSAHN